MSETSEQADGMKGHEELSRVAHATMAASPSDWQGRLEYARAYIKAARSSAFEAEKELLGAASLGDPLGAETLRHFAQEAAKHHALANGAEAVLRMLAGPEALRGL